MSFEMITAKEIEEMYNKEPWGDERLLKVRQDIINIAKSGDFTMFFNAETKRIFLVPKGKPVPFHMQNTLLGR